MRYGLLVIAVLAACEAKYDPSSDNDDPDPDPLDLSASGCHSIEGRYSSSPVTGPDCTSPENFCTAGTTTGDMESSYAFTMATQSPADATNLPGIIFYTG